VISATAKRSELFTPFRYPGGKSALYRYFCGLLALNGMSRATYVEPFAGGAGAALSLLFTERVERVVINDLDPAMYAAWQAMTHDTAEFLELVNAARLTVDEWQKHRETYLRGDLARPLELGYAAFYLNRTSRSGVLTAGPIGGFDQTGNYKIDARFRKDSISERLRQIRAYRNRIDVRNQDGREFIKAHVDDRNTLIYVDPPYFVKGSRLYLNSFTEADHIDLATLLNAHADSRWVLTYDDVPEVRSMFPERRTDSLRLNYSLQRAGAATELIVFSDSLELPVSP